MKREDFSRNRFKLEIKVACSRERLFDYVTTSDGLTQWFLGHVEYVDLTGAPVQGSDLQAGFNYLWKWQKPHEVEGTVLGYTRNESFEVTFGKDFTVTFSVEDIEPGETSLLRLEQTNHNPNEENEFGFINCCVCWTFFLTNLKSVVEQGKDLREQEIINESFVNQ
ncbi:MAG: SRPBCC domain-containing protein [Candidatus Kapaibacterium sp.]